MTTGRSTRRLPLRDLLTHAEKTARDLMEHCKTTLATSVADCRDLSRPVRRHSHYPSMLTVENSLSKLAEAVDENRELGEHLLEQLLEIRDRARRELTNRL